MWKKAKIGLLFVLSTFLMCVSLKIDDNSFLPEGLQNQKLIVLQSHDVEADQEQINPNIHCGRKKPLIARRLRGKLPSSTRLKIYCCFIQQHQIQESYWQLVVKKCYFTQLTEHLNSNLQRLLYPKHSFW